MRLYIVMALAWSSAIHSQEMVERQCTLVSPSKEEYKFSLASRSRDDAIVIPDAFATEGTLAVCVRSMLVPSENDDMVLKSGLDLMISEPGRDSKNPRMAIILGKKPHITFVVVTGKLTRKESQRVTQVLKKLNAE